MRHRCETACIELVDEKKAQEWLESETEAGLKKAIKRGDASPNLVQCWLTMLGTLKVSASLSIPEKKEDLSFYRDDHDIWVWNGFDFIAWVCCADFYGKDSDGVIVKKNFTSLSDDELIALIPKHLLENAKPGG